MIHLTSYVAFIVHSAVDSNSSAVAREFFIRTRQLGVHRITQWPFDPGMLGGAYDGDESAILPLVCAVCCHLERKASTFQGELFSMRNRARLIYM